jgi:hypothetical protein
MSQKLNSAIAVIGIDIERDKVKRRKDKKVTRSRTLFGSKAQSSNAIAVRPLENVGTEYPDQVWCQ